MALSGIAGTIANFLSGKGLSAAGVAGVLGTFQAESGLNPSITNSIGAHGLAQWLGSRRTDLQALASRLGVTENDLNAQLQFLWQELQQPAYAGLLHTLQTTNDPQQAARDFVNIFERPGPGGDPGAPGFALTFFNGGVPGGAGNPGLGAGGTTDTGGGGQTTPNFKSGPLGPYGALFFGSPENMQAVKTGIDGLTQSISAAVTDMTTIANMLSNLTHRSFWVRLGAFLLGIITLIGGFIMLKGAAL